MFPKLKVSTIMNQMSNIPLDPNLQQVVEGFGHSDHNAFKFSSDLMCTPYLW